MELGGYIKFILALAFVLGLIVLLSYGVRRAGFGGIAMAPRPRDGARRLSIVEVAVIDAKHRMVLVRRDDTEHLILIGANSEVVVESGISAPSNQLGDTAC